MRRSLALLLTLAIAAGLLLVCGLLAAEPLAPALPPVPPAAAAAVAPAAAPPPGGQASWMASVVVGGTEHLVPAVGTPETPMLPLAAIAPLLGGELRRGPGGVGWVLRAGEVEAVLAASSAVATVGQAIVQLPQPVMAAPDGSPWVPLELVRRTFGEVMHWDLQWDAGSRRLTAVAQQRRVVPVEWSLVHLQGISTLVLQFPSAPRLQVKENGQQVEVDFLGDQVTPSRPPQISDPFVQSLRFAADRIFLEVAPGAVVEHYQQQDPFRLVFDVYQRVAAAVPPGPPFTAPTRPTIVVDPGHGGVETGAIGPSGTREKELTLLLAQSLAQELQRRLPVRVELTRDEDAELPLDTRAAIANQHQAQLFISVHLNSSVGAGAHGAETYFLSLEASDARAAAAARAENLLPSGPAATPLGPAAGGPSGESTQDLQLILWDLAQSRHLAESQRFAALVQEELNTALGLRDRGVKQAPFRVLMGATMPAVLVELGFISNPEEEKKLLTPEYRQQLVEALVRAVARYQAKGESAPAQAAAGPRAGAAPGQTPHP